MTEYMLCDEHGVMPFFPDKELPPIGLVLCFGDTWSPMKLKTDMQISLENQPLIGGSIQRFFQESRSPEIVQWTKTKPIRVSLLYSFQEGRMVLGKRYREVATIEDDRADAAPDN